MRHKNSYQLVKPTTWMIWNRNDFETKSAIKIKNKRKKNNMMSMVIEGPKRMLK
jgi:hypothetical protein